MRSTVLVVLIAVTATVAGALRFAQPDASAASIVPAEAPVAPGVVPQEADPPVTVRVGGGRENVRIGNANRSGKGRVQNSGLEIAQGRASLDVNGEGVSMLTVGNSEEGKLIRIHVDADAGLTVIGFYDTIAEDRPVNQPDTYACKRCGSVLVCGVEPDCAN